MNSDRWKRVDRLFQELATLPRTEWGSHLDRSCEDDPAVRAEVEALLARREALNGFMETPALGEDFNVLSEGTNRDPEVALRPGEIVGKYRIRRKVGSGGMATVYEAEQKETERTVALKVMRRGVGSRTSIRRFNDEVRILARLSHDGIAQIYDAGFHGNHGEEADVVRFFAMEYIPEGRHLTSFVLDSDLDLRHRVELFAKVCDAVNHGHQRAILHRDLKPSNILVNDDQHPKVIDFGVARVMDLDVATVTCETGFGELVGTLQYMSPEQCDGDPHGVDVRSDVYSLGVILFELLTGSLPYDTGRSGILAATQVVKESPAPSPSSVNPDLVGDLDTIVLTALHKDPDLRYQSASALAADLHRYLNDEPILARAPSLSYRIAKFVRRHRTITALGILLLLAILGGGLGITFALLEARSQRDTAVYEADRAVSVTNFLDEMLATPFEEIDGSKATVRDLLDRASQQLESYFQDERETVAALRRTLGKSYEALGFYPQARTELSHAYTLAEDLHGGADPVTLELLVDLAGSTHDCDRLDDAERLLEEALDRLREHAPDDVAGITRAKNFLGLVWIDMKKLEASRDILAEAAGERETFFGPAHKLTIQCLLNLSVVEQKLGDREATWRLIQDCVDRLETAESPDLLTLAYTKDRLAIEESLRGEEELAERHMKEVLAIYDSVYPEHHPRIAQMLSKIGWTLNRWKKPERAEPYLRRAVTIYEEKSGPAHAHTTTVKVYLGAALGMQAKHGEANELYRKLVSATKQEYGEKHLKTAEALSNLAHASYLARDREASARALAECQAILKEMESPPAITRVLAANLDARLNRDAGETDQAHALINSALRIELPRTWDRDWVSAMLQTTKAELLTDQGKLDRALGLLERAYPVLGSAPPLRQERAGALLERLAALFEERDQPGKAARCREILTPGG